MRQRIPIVLSATALVVALMAMTPLGEAASSQLRATFASNAGKLRGFAPSKAARKNTVVVRGANGKIGRASLPALPRGPRGLAGLAGPVGATGPIGPTGPAGAPNPNADTLDGIDSTAFQTKIRWALFSSDGTIIAQTGGISLASGGGGAYYINFGSSLTGKAILVTTTYTDADPGFRGTAYATLCGGGAQGSTCFAAGTNTDSHVFVATANAANTATQAHGFYIAAIG